MRRSAIVFFACGLAVVVTAACGDVGQGVGDSPEATATPQATAPDSTGSGLYSINDSPVSKGRLFSETSPFNQPIPQDPALHPDSDALIDALARRTPDGIVVSIEQWTVAAYKADATTPTFDVKLTADWAPYGVLKDVPIPAEARPDPEDDGHMTVVDEDAGFVYDFWQAARTDDGWEASWANRTSLSGDGIYPTGLSARGSGFSTLAGLVWPSELAAGAINHALVFTYKPNRAGILVPPASETDGTSDDPLTLPEGARLQLNPDLDLDTLELTPGERTIARALQEYGMILGDTGGTSIVELEIVHPFSFGLESFPDLGLEIEEGFSYLWQIPLDQFRVINYQPISADALSIEVEDSSIFGQ